MPSDRLWLTNFIDRCQRLALGPIGASATAVRLELQTFAVHVPSTVTLPERFVVRGLLVGLVPQLEAAAPNEDHPLARALLAVPSMTPPHRFREELMRPVDRCSKTIGNGESTH